MRPKTKIDAQPLNISLSGPSRYWLLAEAKRRGVSRTQIVEELIAQAETEASRPFAAAQAAPIQPRKSRA